MTPLYVAIEGPHGAGKSTMADELADELADAGITAEAFHHDRPSEWSNAWRSALSYAEQRARLVSCFPADDAPRVLVCDRWVLSTWADAAAGLAEPRDALHRLAHAEHLALPPVRYIILDAPRAVLHERLLGRGEALDVKALDDVRSRYLAVASVHQYPIVDTSAPLADVVARLVEIVRGWL